MRNSAKKNPRQKPNKSLPALTEQTKGLPLNETAASDKSFDFLTYQLDYVTLYRTETFKRLSLVLAFSTFIFLLLMSEATYAYKNNLFNVYVTVINVAAGGIFTAIWFLTMSLLKTKVTDKTSLMAPSRILELGYEGYKEELESKRTIQDYKSTLLQEIYAVSKAEKVRSKDLGYIVIALTLLYLLVIVNSIVIAIVENNVSPKNP